MESSDEVFNGARLPRKYVFNHLLIAGRLYLAGKTRAGRMFHILAVRIGDVEENVLFAENTHKDATSLRLAVLWWTGEEGISITKSAALCGIPDIIQSPVKPLSRQNWVGVVNSNFARVIDFLPMNLLETILVERPNFLFTKLCVYLQDCLNRLEVDCDF